MVKYNFSDNGYNVMFLKPVTDTLDVGVNVREGRGLMIFGNKRF